MAMAARQYAHAGENRSNEHRTAVFVRQQFGSSHDLVIDAGASAPLPLNSVRKWLHGSWALLFSHADDFASYGFEADRWLMLVRDACASAAVRPLALARSTSHSANWVTEVGGRMAALPTDDTRRYPMLRDAAQQVLCEAINGADSRFVMILDDVLRLRRTLVYGTRDRLPSPIDLVAMAAKLRAARAA